jgi:hypothetical protein
MEPIKEGGTVPINTTNLYESKRPIDILTERLAQVVKMSSDEPVVSPASTIVVSPAAKSTSSLEDLSPTIEMPILKLVESPILESIKSDESIHTAEDSTEFSKVDSCPHVDRRKMKKISLRNTRVTLDSH